MTKNKSNYERNLAIFVLGVVVFIIITLIFFSWQGNKNSTCLSEIAQSECESQGLILLNTYFDSNLESYVYVCHRENPNQDLLFLYKMKNGDVDYCKKQ